MKSTCGWDLNLNNRLFRGVCATKKSHKLPFFRHFQKIFVNNLCLKRRIRIYFFLILQRRFSEFLFEKDDKM